MVAERPTPPPEQWRSESDEQTESPAGDFFNPERRQAPEFTSSLVNIIGRLVLEQISRFEPPELPLPPEI